jgi:hypothetical protein
MKKIILVAYIFSTFLLAMLSSCSQHELDTTLDDTPSTTPKFGPNFKFYTDSNLFLETQNLRTSSSSDDFSIRKVTREKGKLTIDVSYSGGCQEHDFEVVWDGVVNLSNPRIVNLMLKQNSHDDTCEALVEDKIEIDLKSYFNNLIEDNNTIFVVSNGSSIQVISSLSGEAK